MLLFFFLFNPEVALVYIYVVDMDVLSESNSVKQSMDIRGELPLLVSCEIPII